METNSILIPLLAAFGLAAVHLFSSYLRGLDGPPRSRFLSVAGGISVAFVILRLLPGVGEGQEVVQEKVSEGAFLSALEKHVYLLVLLSFIVFYGVERLARKSKKTKKAEESEEVTSSRVFWVHLSSFAFLNILISFLLLPMLKESLMALLFFFIAMFLKFVVNDNSLHRLHKNNYAHKGRWILAAVVFVGWGLSILIGPSEVAPVFVKALIAGGALLNVLKEELPEAKESNFWAFAISGLGYAALLIFLSP